MNLMSFTDAAKQPDCFGGALGQGQTRGLDSAYDYAAREKMAAMQTQSPQCERAPEIPDRIARLGQRVDTLACALERLHERLDPVMRPCGPDANCNDKTQPASSLIADQIACIEQRVSAACNVVADIVIRLEL